MTKQVKKELINSTEYRKEVIFPNFSFFILTPIVFIYALISEGGNPIAIALFFFIGFIVLGTIFFAMWIGYTDGPKKKYLYRISVGEDAICSYVRKKLICRVDRKLPIYYVIFKSNEATNSVVSYIAISNKPFMNNDIASRGNTMLSAYDETSQIVMQYNQKTKHLFDLAHWENVQNETVNKQGSVHSENMEELPGGMTFRCHALTYGQNLGLCIIFILFAVFVFQFSNDLGILIFPFMGITALVQFLIAYNYTVTINDMGIWCSKSETVEWGYSWEQIVKLKICEAPTHATQSPIRVTLKSVKIIPTFYVKKGETCYFELGREAEVALQRYKPEHIELD